MARTNTLGTYVFQLRVVWFMLVPVAKERDEIICCATNITTKTSMLWRSQCWYLFTLVARRPKLTWFIIVFPMNIARHWVLSSASWFSPFKPHSWLVIFHREEHTSDCIIWYLIIFDYISMDPINCCLNHARLDLHQYQSISSIVGQRQIWLVIR